MHPKELDVGLSSGFEIFVHSNRRQDLLSCSFADITAIHVSDKNANPHPWDVWVGRESYPDLYQ